MNAFILRFTLVIVVLALLTLIVRGDFISSSPLVIIGQACAVILMVSARLAFRNQQFRLDGAPGSGALIRRGPYRWIRHPMYTGALVLIWVSILGHWSPVNGAIGAVVLVFAVLRIEAEERVLRSHYPEFADYAKKAKRMIPFVY